MSVFVCEFLFKIFTAYLCFLNLANITAKRPFTVGTQYKTFFGIPYMTHQVLEIHEREYEYTLPAIAAALACMGCDTLHSVCLLFISKECHCRLWKLTIRCFWFSKILWFVLYMIGFVSILYAHHQLFMATNGLRLDNVEDMLTSLKCQYVWQTTVFIFAIICWMEEDTLSKNYYKLLVNGQDYQI